MSPWDGMEVVLIGRDRESRLQTTLIHPQMRKKPATEEIQSSAYREERKARKRTDSNSDHMARYQSKCRHHEFNKQTTISKGHAPHGGRAYLPAPNNHGISSCTRLSVMSVITGV